MKLQELTPGTAFRVPGIPATFELLRLGSASATVRSRAPERREVVFADGREVSFTRYHVETISLSTVVEVAS